ncbi:MAG: hypothetical protein L0G48_10475, partial [Staphylococcus equorum]|nr:hypothetical protein [Staphylococcus equorum]
VFINGIGVSSPLGMSIKQFSSNIFSGELFWKLINKYKTTYNIPSFTACGFTETTSLESIVKQAFFNACIDAKIIKRNEDKTLICFATSNGLEDNIFKSEDSKLIDAMSCHTFLIPTVSSKFKKFKITCFNTACASGGDAISYAYRELKYNHYKQAIVIGADTLSPITASGFMSLGAMSLKGCKPFTTNRDGMSLGEGAACIVLSSQYTSNSYSEIIGVGQANNHYHITAPNPDGTALFTAMNNAIREANIKPSQINYVNAHGTGTKLNDVMELNALHKVFKDIPSVSSSKGQIGHTLGGAGVFEAIIVALAIQRHRLPPNIVGQNKLLENAPFIVTTSKTSNIKFAISNSIGFGGNAVSIVIKDLEK